MKDTFGKDLHLGDAVEFKLRDPSVIGVATLGIITAISTIGNMCTIKRKIKNSKHLRLSLYERYNDEYLKKLTKEEEFLWKMENL